MSTSQGLDIGSEEATILAVIQSVTANSRAKFTRFLDCERDATAKIGVNFRRSVTLGALAAATETLGCRIGRAKRVLRPADALWDRICQSASQGELPRTE